MILTIVIKIVNQEYQELESWFRVASGPIQIKTDRKCDIDITHWTCCVVAIFLTLSFCFCCHFVYNHFSLVSLFLSHQRFLFLHFLWVLLCWFYSSCRCDIPVIFGGVDFVDI
ncbi:hypothetical protein P5673_020008 [Acropora cervicornis]|uniref:Uncharacterized protein n=1 Tax=Acropora cervicornis TaxID=6130 RepID=A0AAD9QB70_ACRCE|nr:hypothetical protein P5673_020008 [Acropora cervicornis]